MLRKKLRSAKKENELLHPPAVELPEDNLDIDIVFDLEQD